MPPLKLNSLYYRLSILVLLISIPLAGWPSSQVNSAQKTIHLVHARALFGQPKYKADFTHFGYANPSAPKGGELRLAATGSYDTFNPFVLKGTAAAGIGQIYDTLLARSWDEPLTKYALIAEKIEYPDDNSWIAFHINPKARFNDGHPLTAEDVAFSFKLLMDNSPLQKTLYAGIDQVKVTSKYRVLFTFKKHHSRELPLVLGQLPILPKHIWGKKGANFSQADLTIPVGSGPYKVKCYEPGRFVEYIRVKDYWGKDLPVNRGRFNFDTIRYDYYRDATVMLEAFRAGNYDWRIENNPRNWPTAYQGPALKRGDIIMAQFQDHNPQTLSMVFNNRHSLFQSLEVRKALSRLFNFDVINDITYHDDLRRANSFFAGTDMAATGLPSREELKLLAPYKKELPTSIFTRPYTLPTIASPVSEHNQLAKALATLSKAGWTFKEGKLLNNETGQQLSFEILLNDPTLEKALLPYKQLLARLGVNASVRVVDNPQYITRLQNFDFDVVLHTFRHTPSPGIEQRYFWGSENADRHGSSNLAGVSNPIIDSLLNNILLSTTRAQLVTSIKAVDRSLTQNYYAHPLWYQPKWRVIYHKGLKYPLKSAPYTLALDTWWHEPMKHQPANTKPE